MAWDYFFSQPLSRKMHRKSRDRDLLNHVCRYIWSKGWTIITPGWESIGLTAAISCSRLSFDSQGEDKPLPWIDGWRCVFDTKTGQFSIPADFADHNAKAVEFPDRRRR